MVGVGGGAFASAEPPALETVEYLADGGDESSPILIAIHGYGDTPQAFLQFAISLAPGMRVIAVQGPLKHPRQGFSWYRIDDSEQSTDIERAANRLHALIGSLRKQYPRAGRPIVMGFSQGAVMSLSVLIRHPNIIRGAIAISGYLDARVLPPNAPNSKPPDVILLHGQSDNVVPFSRGLQAYNGLSRAGYRVEWQPYSGGHHITSDVYAQARRWMAKILLAE